MSPEYSHNFHSSDMTSHLKNIFVNTTTSYRYSWTKTKLTTPVNVLVMVIVLRVGCFKLAPYLMTIKSTISPPFQVFKIWTTPLNADSWSGSAFDQIVVSMLDSLFVFMYIYYWSPDQFCRWSPLEWVIFPCGLSPYYSERVWLGVCFKIYEC